MSLFPLPPYVGFIYLFIYLVKLCLVLGEMSRLFIEVYLWRPYPADLISKFELLMIDRLPPLTRIRFTLLRPERLYM